MAKAKSLDIAARVRTELDDLARAGCENVTLANLGSVTVDSLLENSTIRDAIAKKGHTTSEAQREYILAEIIANQDKIISDTVTERNSENEPVTDKNGRPVCKNVYKYGEPVPEDELRKALGEDTKVTIPSEAMNDEVLNGSYRKRVEDERARIRDRDRKIEEAAKQADDENGGPEKLSYKSEIGDGSDDQPQASQQEDAARKARAEAVQAELAANQAAKKALTDGLDELMRLGKLTPEEYEKGKAVIALNGFIQDTNAAIRSLSDVSNYMSSTRDGTVKTWWVGRQFKRERNRHAKIAAKALQGFNDLSETLQDRVGGTGMMPEKARGGIFSSLRDRVGNKGRTADASQQEPKTSVLRKAGGTIKKAAGAAVVIGGVVAGRVFKSFHPLMWVKGTYQDIREALKTSIDDNKRPENAKDPATVEQQYADMVEPTPESTEMSRGCRDAVAASHAMTLEALMATPEGRQYVANALISTPEWGTAVNNSIMAFIRANGGFNEAVRQDPVQDKTAGTEHQDPPEGQSSEKDNGHDRSGQQAGTSASKDEPDTGKTGSQPADQQSGQQAGTSASQDEQDDPKTVSTEEVIKSVNEAAERRDKDAKKEAEKIIGSGNGTGQPNDGENENAEEDSNDVPPLDELEELLESVHTPEVTAAAREADDAADAQEEQEHEKSVAKAKTAPEPGPDTEQAHEKSVAETKTVPEPEPAPVHENDPEEQHPEAETEPDARTKATVTESENAHPDKVLPVLKQEAAAQGSDESKTVGDELGADKLKTLRKLQETVKETDKTAEAAEEENGGKSTPGD